MKNAIVFFSLASAIIALSACTDYVAQMESDFEVWASQQGGTYQQGGDYSEWGSDELPPPSSSSTSYNTSSIVTGSLLDERDGQIYKTVLIGSQVWMAQNLNYASDFYMSYCYGGLSSNCSKYGRLYTWAAAMDSLGAFSTNSKGCGYKTTCMPSYPVRGICPSGWHLPDSTEWEKLFIVVAEDGQFANNLKSKTGWDGFGGVDKYGFSALPAGYREWTGSYFDEGSKTTFYTSTERSSEYAYFISMGIGGGSLSWPYPKSSGYSVRCIQN